MATILVTTYGITYLVPILIGDFFEIEIVQYQYGNKTIIKDKNEEESIYRQNQDKKRRNS